MNFDISRLRRSERIVGAAAVAFFISLFLFKWLGASVNSSLGGVNLSNSVNGWHSFSNSRWIWLITILLAQSSRR